jgi:hypothetical protein
MSNWTDYSVILLIPREGREHSVRARVSTLLKIGGIPSFVETWEPVEEEKPQARPAFVQLGCEA